MKLFTIEKGEKDKAIEMLIASSSPTPSFFLMLLLSVIIVTLGILKNNVPIVIGGMLVSPLLSPILAISLGITMANHELIMRSFKVLLKSIIYSIILALILTVFFIGKDINSEILSRANPSLVFFGVAMASGLAASFAVTRKELSERMVGVAVAIALLPPIAVIGIGIGFFNWEIVAGAAELFLINLFGILLSSLIVFSLFGFYPQKKKVQEELKAEEKELEEIQNGN